MNDFTIAAEAAEMRLDRFLRREIPGLTQGVLQKLLRNGKIKLNGAKADANARLAEGDLLRVPEIAPPVAMPKERHIVKMDPARIKELEAMIIYRDDAVIALNKPAGLAVQGGSGITVHVDGMLDACARARMASGQNWYTGWTVTPPAFCCWPAVPRQRASSLRYSEAGMWRRFTGRC